jgi:hypothetical protein
MSKRLFGGLAAASCLVLSAAAFAGEADTSVVPAASIDSGLGELAPLQGSVEVWLYAQPAPKQDSGLGDMPAAGDLKEVWMYMQPAPKVDSGLGDPAPRAMAAREGAGG